MRLIQQTYNGNTNTANGYQNHYQFVDTPPYVRAKPLVIRAQFPNSLFMIRSKPSDSLFITRSKPSNSLFMIRSKPSDSLFMIRSKPSNSLFITRLKPIDSCHIFDKECFVFGFHSFHFCLHNLFEGFKFMFQVVVIVRHIGIISREDEKGE